MAVSLLYKVLSPVRVVNIGRGLNWMIGFIDRLYTPLSTARNYSAIADPHILQFTVLHTHTHSKRANFSPYTPTVTSDIAKIQK
jgi:hypothetical protein